MNDQKEPVRYLDLCSGIGGFHQAMDRLGCICVGASEIDQVCIDTYRANFPDTPMLGDVRDFNPKDLPDFQFVCAGFPCQPFSKAGKRKGFKDESRGQLFYTIMDIIDAHDEVEFILFENVRNLADRKEYWEAIQEELAKRDFTITTKPIILSPSDFGIPQIRERVFILGIRSDVKNHDLLPYGQIIEADLWLRKATCKPNAAFDILDETPSNPVCLAPDKEEALIAWDEFREEIGITTVGFPIWLSCFGLGIEFDRIFFNQIGLEEMPGWKQNYVRRNRHLYQMNRDYIDAWVRRYNMLDRTKLLQKFEWNCGEDVPDIKHGLVQIRQSGIRVKRPDCFPSLVAMATTPLIWDEGINHFREITVREAARLQSFDEEFVFTGSNKQVYKELGNAVNVEIAYQLAQGLLRLRKVD
ncbi:DNA (cytosine-5-)-methyltransferase [Enterorhabdus sp. NM05_H27]|nr:DNA (cytosine-5-)-methyltransferase [Enterorhabdus sp. NM05_H27]